MRKTQRRFWIGATRRRPLDFAAGDLTVDDHPALHTVDLPALAAGGAASLTDNPQWCVAAPFDAPPPGATVVAAGNLCDP